MTSTALPYRALVAELVGTLILTLAVSASIASSSPVATPLVAGIALMVLVYAIGGVSGAHVNPAVTLGLLGIKRISVQNALLYVLMQIIGAGVAGLLLAAMGGVLPDVGATDSLGIVLAEALGACILVLAVSSAVLGKVPAEAAGLAVGGALITGITVAGSASLGILNPAVAIGLQAVSLSYLLAPIAGGIAGAWLLSWIAAK